MSLATGTLKLHGSVASIHVRAPWLGWAIVMLAVAVTLVMLTESLARAGVKGWDAMTYLAAGERLNASHHLYALAPGDRWVWINPPFWSVPLLSPPLIAVIWRPLAALPNEVGLGLWWLASAASIAIAVLALARRQPLLTGIALLFLAPSLAWELGVANVNGFLLSGTVAVWLIARRDQNTWAGVLIGVMAAVKLWPIVLLAWFLATGRPRAVTGAMAAGGVCLAISIVGAGLPAHMTYLAVAGSTPPSEFSLTAMVAALGLPIPWLNYAVLAFAVVEIWALRRRPELAFAVAVGAMIFGSPVANGNTYAILLAALAPIAFGLAGSDKMRFDKARSVDGLKPRRWSMSPYLRLPLRAGTRTDGGEAGLTASSFHRAEELVGAERFERSTS